MLSVKQLRDIKNCGEIECETCSAIGYCADEIDLSKELAETALEYRKILERFYVILDYIDLEVSISDFGKTVFLTREEAEKAAGGGKDV